MIMNFKKNRVGSQTKFETLSRCSKATNNLTLFVPLNTNNSVLNYNNAPKVSWLRSNQQESLAKQPKLTASSEAWGPFSKKAVKKGPNYGWGSSPKAPAKLGSLGRMNSEIICFAVKESQSLKQSTKTFYNYTFDKGRLKSLVSWSLKTNGEYKTLKLLENLKKTGFEYATKAGISLGIEDLKIPPKKALLLYQAEEISKTAIDQYNRSEITGVERFQRLIDTWHRTSEQLKQEVIDYFESTDVLNPVYMMAFSGARGNISQVRQLVGMRGLMADPKGQIIDYPIRSNFREGLTLTEYIISSYGARKGIVDTALRTANAGYLTRRLVDVAQHVVVSSFDCGTNKGIFLTDMKEGNKTIYSLQTRLMGRVLARDLFVSSSPSASLEKKDLDTVFVAHKQQKLASRNQEVSSDLAFAIAKHYKKVFVRSPLTCQTQKLVCQLCYGWSLAQGNLVSIGEAVGIVAAQSIGEPGTQLTMRTFHTGGVFSGDVSDQIRAPYTGFVHYLDKMAGTFIRTPEGKMAFLSKTDGFVCVYNNSNSIDTAKKFKVPAYTILYFKNGDKVNEKQVIAQISAFARQQNMRDDSELTVKSEMQGQFFLKTLQVEEQMLGPKPKKLSASLTAKRNSADMKKGLDVSAQTQIQNPLLMEKTMSSWDWGYAWVLSCKLYKLPFLSHEGSNTIQLVPTLGDFVDQKSIMTQIQWFLPQHGGYSIYFQKPFNNSKGGLNFSLGHLGSTGFPGIQSKGYLQSTGSQNASLDVNRFFTSKKREKRTVSLKLFKKPNTLFKNVNILKNLLFLDISKIAYKKIGYFLDNNNQNSNYLIFLPDNLKGVNHSTNNQITKTFAMQTSSETSFLHQKSLKKNFFGIQLLDKRSLMQAKSGPSLLTRGSKERSSAFEKAPNKVLWVQRTHALQSKGLIMENKLSRPLAPFLENVRPSLVAVSGSDTNQISKTLQMSNTKVWTCKGVSKNSLKKLYTSLKQLSQTAFYAGKAPISNTKKYSILVNKDSKKTTLVSTNSTFFMHPWCINQKKPGAFVKSNNNKVLGSKRNFAQNGVLGTLRLESKQNTKVSLLQNKIAPPINTTNVQNNKAVASPLYKNNKKEAPDSINILNSWKNISFAQKNLRYANIVGLAPKTYRYDGSCFKTGFITEIPPTYTSSNAPYYQQRFVGANVHSGAVHLNSCLTNKKTMLSSAGGTLLKRIGNMNKLPKSIISAFDSNKVFKTLTRITSPGQNLKGIAKACPKSSFGPELSTYTGLWAVKTFEIAKAVQLDKNILSMHQGCIKKTNCLTGLDSFKKLFSTFGGSMYCSISLSRPLLKESSLVYWQGAQATKNNGVLPDDSKKSGFDILEWLSTPKKDSNSKLKWYVNKKPRFLPAEFAPSKAPVHDKNPKHNTNEQVQSGALQKPKSAYIYFQPVTETSSMAGAAVQNNQVGVQECLNRLIRAPKTQALYKTQNKQVKLTPSASEYKFSILLTKHLQKQENTVQLRNAPLVHNQPRTKIGPTNSTKKRSVKSYVIKPKEWLQVQSGALVNNKTALLNMFNLVIFTKKTNLNKASNKLSPKQSLAPVLVTKKQKLPIHLHKSYFITKSRTVNCAQKLANKKILYKFSIEKDLFQKALSSAITPLKNPFIVLTQKIYTNLPKLGGRSFLEQRPYNLSFNGKTNFQSCILNKQAISLNPLSKIPNATLMILQNKNLPKQSLIGTSHSNQSKADNTKFTLYAPKVHSNIDPVTHKPLQKMTTSASLALGTTKKLFTNSLHTAPLCTYVITFSMPSLFDYQFKNVNINLTHMSNSNTLFNFFANKPYSAALLKQKMYDLAINNNLWKGLIRTNQSFDLGIFKKGPTETFGPEPCINTWLEFKDSAGICTYNAFSIVDSKTVHEQKSLKSKNTLLLNKVFAVRHGCVAPIQLRLGLAPKVLTKQSKKLASLATLDQFKWGNALCNPIFNLQKLLLGVFKQVCFEFNLVVKVKNYKNGLINLNQKSLAPTTPGALPRSWVSSKNKPLTIMGLNKKYKSTKRNLAPTNLMLGVASLDLESSLDSYAAKTATGASAHTKTTFKVCFDNINYALTSLASTSFLSTYSGEILSYLPDLGPQVVLSGLSNEPSHSFDSKLKYKKEFAKTMQKYSSISYLQKQTIKNNKNRCLLLTNKDFISYKYLTNTQLGGTNTQVTQVQRFALHKNFKNKVKSTFKAPFNLESSKTNYGLNMPLVHKAIPAQTLNKQWFENKMSWNKLHTIQVGSFIVRGTVISLAEDLLHNKDSSKTWSAYREVLNKNPDNQRCVTNLSGQIIHWNQEKVTVRKAQPFFISAKTTFHAFHGDFVQNKEPIFTLIYQKLKTGDIIQGIPKVEQFFEARTTKRGRLFRDNLPNLLKGLFLKYYFYCYQLLKQGVSINIQKDKPQTKLATTYNTELKFGGPENNLAHSYAPLVHKEAANLKLDYSYLALQWAVKQSFYKIQQIAVDGVLRVYRSQGVTISDKHLEIIVKQMTTKVRVIKSGQTGFFPGEIVDYDFVETLNSVLIHKKIHYEPMILGITKASLHVDSFLSSASFQQTSRILSQAALFNKKDFLKGVKENVILGNLIPAGTGYLVSLDR